MAAVVSAAVEFGDAATPWQAPNLHVRYDDNDMEIDESDFIMNAVCKTSFFLKNILINQAVI